MSPTRMSRIESSIRIVLEYKDALNRHDINGIIQLISDECVLETYAPAPNGDVITGKGALTQYWQGFFRLSPDARIEIEEIFGMGLRCIMRWRYQWTDTAGKSKTIRGVDIFLVKDDLISEILSYVKRQEE